MLNFAALRTPEHDGQTLVEPTPDPLADAVATNTDRIGAYTFSILDQPVSALRRTTRESLGLPIDGAVIATGHQPELIHPGVWAKHVVTARLAEVLGGVAVNFVVDNDAPKTNTLTVPSVRDKAVSAERIAIPNLNPGYAYEYRAGLTFAQVDTLRSHVAAVMGDAFAATRLDLFFAAWAEQEADSDLVDQMIAARQAMERSFRLELLERRVSSCWPNPLVAHVILDASRFAARYNEALAHYRRENRVRGKNRPIPDLAHPNGRVELPFWIYAPDERRRRMFVRPVGEYVEILADNEPVGRLPVGALGRAATAVAAFETLAPRVVRPRALMLTLWARVFVADLFVHGIGGAKYDRITDSLIEGYFGAEPPTMACVSATLRMPLPRDRTTLDDLRAAVHRRRDLRYNPQRYIQVTRRTGEWVDRREAAIARSRRLRADEPGNHRRRKEAFDEIRALNAALVASNPELETESLRTLQRIQAALSANAVSGSREYFFGLHPASSLERLCAALPSTDELLEAVEKKR